MRNDAVANLELAVSANSTDDTSRFHAQSHWRSYAEVPITSPCDLVPMTDAGDMNVDDQLSSIWTAWRI